MPNYVEALVRIVVAIDADNPPISNHLDLIVNLPHDITFPLVDDGINVKGKVVEYETLDCRKI